MSFHAMSPTPTNFRGDTCGRAVDELFAQENIDDVLSEGETPGTLDLAYTGHRHGEDPIAGDSNLNRYAGNGSTIEPPNPSLHAGWYKNRGQTTTTGG